MENRRGVLRTRIASKLVIHGEHHASCFILYPLEKVSEQLPHSSSVASLI